MEARLVDDRADPGQGASALRRDRAAEHAHRAAGGPGQAEHDPDQGGLARAVRSQVAERGASRHEQLNLVDGDVGPEPFREAVGLDRRGRLQLDCVHGGNRVAIGDALSSCAGIICRVIPEADAGRSGRGDEPGFVGEDDELGAVAGAELGQDPAHVRLDRREAHMQRLGEFGVGEPPGDQGQYLSLAFGEFV